MDRFSQERVIPLEIYTDGACKKIGTQTFGGWSYIAVEDSQKMNCGSGGELSTTNQRMELEAIRQALVYASKNRKSSQKVIIYSDSAYAINCYAQKWYENWRHNGWVNAAKKEVANQDLWIEIIPYFDNLWYYFKKVEGHSGVFWNEQCDIMAQREANDLKINWRG